MIVGLFRPTRYVLKIFRCLDVSNRVRNRNKVKKTFIEFETSIMPIGITNIHKQINVSKFINKLVFVFCEFNRIANKMMAKLSF